MFRESQGSIRGRISSTCGLVCCSDGRDEMARSVVMKAVYVMVDTVTIDIIARTIEGFYFVGGG